MGDRPPPECQPLQCYHWVGTNSLFFAILMDVLPWLNWATTKHIIKSEVLTNQFVQIASAKTGFWLRYTVNTTAQKLTVEIFIRTVEA